MSDLSQQVADAEERCILDSLGVLDASVRNDLNVKQDIALNIVLGLTRLPTGGLTNFWKLQSAVFLRHWHVAWSLCLRGQYLGSAVVVRAALESLARVNAEGTAPETVASWFDDERVTFTTLVGGADPSGSLLTVWRRLSEIAHGKTAAANVVAGSGRLLLGPEFDSGFFEALLSVLDTVMTRFLRVARERFVGAVQLDPDTQRLLDRV